MWHSFKGSASHALSANVPKNDFPRVLRGLDTLCDDPLPDGRQKRKLKDGGGLFRCKVHGYRVMYIFDDTHVSVLDIRPREDDHATYGSLPEPGHLGAGPDAELSAEDPSEDPAYGYLEEAPAERRGTPLSQRLTGALLVPPDPVTQTCSPARSRPPTTRITRSSTAARSTRPWTAPSWTPTALPRGATLLGQHRHRAQGARDLPRPSHPPAVLLNAEPAAGSE